MNAAPEGSDAPSEAPRVLVVDDESVICDLLRDCLEFEGFVVHTAHSGEQAVEVFRKEPFDLVLTDMKMPGISGIELLKRLGDLSRDVMTVVMTGFGTVETAIETMRRGAFDYILKPFKPEDVVRVLRRALDKQRLQRENFELRESVGFYELSEALSSAMPLDEQLQLIVRLVRENFHADGVSIVMQDPKNPGLFVERVADGVPLVQETPQKLIARFLQGDSILAHGNHVGLWLDNAATPERVIHSFMSVPLRVRGAPFGALNVGSVTDGLRFSESQRKGLSILGGRAANAIETDRMYGNIKATFTETIEGFARALEAKDPYTHGHSDRVAMYSKLIAETLGLPGVEVDRISHGGLMHDIGKIGIRSQELSKPQKLTAEEYRLFQTHPVLGRRIIEPISFLVHLVPCVYHHHEAWNGGGYPDGLDGEGIPLEARILAVADAYDAMTSDRPYRKALPHAVALAELRRCSGKQFDPAPVQAFLSVIDAFRGDRRARGLPVPD